MAKKMCATFLKRASSSSSEGREIESSFLRLLGDVAVVVDADTVVNRLSDGCFKSGKASLDSFTRARVSLKRAFREIDRVIVQLSRIERNTK